MEQTDVQLETVLMSLQPGSTATSHRMDASMRTIVDTAPKIIFWHRELPPIEAESMGEHTIEATSGRVQGTIAHRDELWTQCQAELMVQTRHRLTEEIARLGGRYAHVRKESIDTKHDDATGEAWLHGQFGYTLYR